MPGNPGKSRSRACATWGFASTPLRQGMSADIPLGPMLSHDASSVVSIDHPMGSSETDEREQHTQFETGSETWISDRERRPTAATGGTMAHLPISASGQASNGEAIALIAGTRHSRRGSVRRRDGHYFGKTTGDSHSFSTSLSGFMHVKQLAQPSRHRIHASKPKLRSASSAAWWSCSEVPPEMPMPPISRPSSINGAPPPTGIRRG